MLITIEFDDALMARTLLFFSLFVFFLIVENYNAFDVGDGALDCVMGVEGLGEDKGYTINVLWAFNGYFRDNHKIS